MKKYVDIERIKPAYAQKFKMGEFILVEEKIDFSNGQISWENEQLLFCSRRQELTETNSLNGFTELGRKLNPEIFKNVFGDRYIVFGEWAGADHKIQYPYEVKKKFWVFDIFDKEKQEYLQYETCKAFYEIWVEQDPAAKEFCPFVPVFYYGEFKGWEHLRQFVGKTSIGAEPCGEGIVIKRQSILSKEVHNSSNPYYVKWVSDRFSEVQKVKKVDPEKIKKRDAEIALVRTIVTQRRVEKQLEKMVEDNIIPPDWNTEDMKTIAKNIITLIYQDCVKEEKEIVEQVSNFGKLCGSVTMDLVRGILNKKNNPIT